MEPKIGIIYSTVDGQTLKICNKLKEVLQQNNQEVDLISIDDF
ncbi:MAG: menaquinone-dependent protoporphyrinogen IX dehydrogenase, partial [Gelidibacter sp.]|nr:menaquinone-dependent protoporphyrinogen IX dehydrogenase [Gelidibacter sp.]